MALYAFDGTGSDWHAKELIDQTNVVRFIDYYGRESTSAIACSTLSDDAEYIAGVGTRLGLLGRVFGGFNGAGGRERVRELLRHFAGNWRQGDPAVDVIGFSRGAALALHFCNALSDGVDIGGHLVKPTVRFLGLWDTVPAFGLPGILIDAFNHINLGWRLHVPPNVERCFHAMALDENRQAFQIHRPKVMPPAGAGNSGAPVLEELWFRGVHTDIGGGNGKYWLSSIALHWMLECAKTCGVPVNTAKMEELRDQFAPQSPPHSNHFSGENERRQPRTGDRFHPTAAEPLAVGKTKEIVVVAKEKFNISTILVEPDAEYIFSFDPADTWVDQDIVCTAAGWPEAMPDKPGWLDNLKWGILKSYFFSNLRRVPRANWFELVACVNYDLASATPIGSGQHAHPESPWRPAQYGRLALFANDAEVKYGNNSGALCVKIQRTK